MPSRAYPVTAGYTRQYEGRTGPDTVYNCQGEDAVILDNTKDEPDLTLYITMTVTTGFIAFKYKLLYWSTKLK